MDKHVLEIEIISHIVRCASFRWSCLSIGNNIQGKLYTIVQYLCINVCTAVLRAALHVIYIKLGITLEDRGSTFKKSKVDFTTVLVSVLISTLQVIYTSKSNQILSNDSSYLREDLLIKIKTWSWLKLSMPVYLSTFVIVRGGLLIEIKTVMSKVVYFFFFFFYEWEHRTGTMCPFSSLHPLRKGKEV